MMRLAFARTDLLFITKLLLLHSLIGFLEALKVLLQQFEDPLELLHLRLQMRLQYLLCFVIPEDLLVRGEAHAYKGCQWILH